MLHFQLHTSHICHHFLTYKITNNHILILFKLFFCCYPAKISSVVRNMSAKLLTTLPVVSSSLLIECEIGLPSGRANKKFG